MLERVKVVNYFSKVLLKYEAIPFHDIERASRLKIRLGYSYISLRCDQNFTTRLKVKNRSREKLEFGNRKLKL